MPSPDVEPEHVTTSKHGYDHSAEQYVEAIGSTVSPLTETPIDQAVLRAFGEELRSESAGSVIDAGCGPGRVTRFLADLGLDVSGIDISARMIDAARAAHPDLGFDVGSLTSLRHPDRSVSAVVYWYSIIATPPERLTAAWHELDRVLDDRGRALIAFQSGSDEVVERHDAHGSSATLTLYRHDVDHVARTLVDAGFEVLVDLRRKAVLAHEITPQAVLIAARI